MPFVYVLGGPDLGRRFEVGSGAVLGRLADCELPVRHASVSRRHARLELAAGRWYVVDLGSRNGVRVGGQKVERAELNDEAEFVLGELALRFRLDDEHAAEPEAPVHEPEAVAERPGPKAGGGLQLEEDVDLEALAPRGRRAESSALASARASDERQERRAEILRSTAPRAGLLTGDLSQQPVWVQWTVGLLAVATFGGLAYLGYLGVLWLRGG